MSFLLQWGGIENHLAVAFAWVKCFGIWMSSINSEAVMLSSWWAKEGLVGTSYVPSANSLILQQQIPCQLMPSDGSWGPIYVVGQNFARKYCTSSSWGLFRLGFKCLQASSDVLNGTIGHSVQIKTWRQETCAAVEWGGSTLTTTRRLIYKMTG